MKGLRLVSFDLDGTLTKGESSVWQRLHDEFGTRGKARVFMEQFFAGEITYPRWAELDSSLWAGHTIAEVMRVVDRSEVLDGAVEVVRLLRQHGIETVIISGGLDVMATKLATAMGIDPVADVLTNSLGFDPATGVLSGTTKSTVMWNNKGELLLKEICAKRGIPPEAVCHVGDGENDIFAFKVAGFSIALNSAKPSVDAAAKCAIKTTDMRSLLPILLPPAKILWVRHAHGEHNAACEKEGPTAYLSDRWRDARLTEEGKKQADIARLKLAEEYREGFDRVFVSPLHRCIETAAIIAPRMKLVADDRIIERLGLHPCNLRATAQEITSRWGGAETVDVSRLQERPPWPPCYESWGNLLDRTQRFRSELVTSLRPGEVVVVVAHYESILAVTGQHMNNAACFVDVVPMFPPWSPWINLGPECLSDVAAAEAAQESLRSKALAAIESFPRPGIYAGETDADWERFFQSILKTFDAEEGVRGEVRKQVREKMKANSEDLAQALAILGCTVETPISVISKRFDMMPKGRAWKNLEKLRKKIEILEGAVSGLAFMDTMISVTVSTNRIASLFAC